MVPIHTNFNKSILLIKSNTKYLFQKILATSKWLPSRQTPTLPKFSLSSHRQNIYLKKYWQSPNASHPHKFQQYKSIIYIKSKHWCEKYKQNKKLINKLVIYKQSPAVQMFSLLGQTRNFDSFCDHQNRNYPQQFLSSQSAFRVRSRKFRLNSVICVLICIMIEIHVHFSQATHTFWNNSSLCALDETSCYSNFWLSQFWLLPATSVTIVCLLMLLAWQAFRQTKQFWQRNQVSVTVLLSL